MRNVKASRVRVDEASQIGQILETRSNDLIVVRRDAGGPYRAMKTVTIAAAQTVEFREDIEAALACVADVAARAEAASLLCFPEGFLQGYLTDEASARRNALDLASPGFEFVLNRFPKTGPMIVMGLIEVEEGRLFNTAIVVDRRAVIGRYRKAHLLGSERIFDAGSDNQVFEIGGLRFGINICYDTNFPGAARKIADLGASLIVCPANNMLRRKTAEIFKDLYNSVRGERCRETGLWLVSADVTGERDGRISWGPTAVLNPAGEVVAQLPFGQTGLLVFDIPCHRESSQSSDVPISL
jgi:predicted amidohydrolase